MRKFEVGKIYYCSSICNQDCKWFYKVIARTACTVTLLTDEGKTIKKRINKEWSKDLDAETVFPLGYYSMCPSLSA